MRVAIIPLPEGMQAFYRIHQPYGYLKNILGKDIYIYDRNTDPMERLGNEINLADIVIYQLPYAEKIYKLVRAIMNSRDKKRKMVVDFDDDIFNISPWNPRYDIFGTKDISLLYSNKEQVDDLMAVMPENWKRFLQINPDGSATITMWKDKTGNFDIEANLLKQRAVQRITEEVDLLTVTTPQLADHYRKYRPEGKIAVLPNLINFEKFLPMKKKNDGKLRIVWQGGSSHYQDILMVRPELISFAKKHPEVVYAFMGIRYEGMFHDIKDQVEWIPWHDDISTYSLAVSELGGDIAICPLTDDTFNSGKSPLKWEEMSAMKVPCVCSPTVYGNYIEHGKTGFIARQGEWGNCLEELLDPKKREQIWQNAYDEVKKKFSIENANMYWSALEDLFS